MIREVKFESQDRRIKQIIAALNENGIKDIEEANAICEAHGLDPYMTCEETQPICFENAKWAYVVGCAIAIKKGCKNAAEAAEAIGIGLQAFCIPGSVADDRKVGIGHGNLAAMLLREETKCFGGSAHTDTLQKTGEAENGARRSSACRTKRDGTDRYRDDIEGDRQGTDVQISQRRVRHQKQHCSHKTEDCQLRCFCLCFHIQFSPCYYSLKG